LAIDLKKVKIPVFAINGEFDSPHAKTERMARELKNFKNVVIPGKNHIGAVVPPMPLYVESLTKFIDSHD
jgi:pimeloyl-ACP methyl ester carboxylesterase